MYAPAAVHWPEKYYVPGSSCQPRGHDMVLLNFQLIFTMLQLIYAIGTPKYATGNNHSMITSRVVIFPARITCFASGCFGANISVD